MRSSLRSVAGGIASFLMTTAGSAGAHTTRQAPTGCPAAAQAAFAFWEGTWNYAVPGFDPAVSVFTRTERGCHLEEQFVDIKGNKQHTVISYDAGAREWRRSVVDPFRSYTSTGHFDGAVIHFYETATARESYQLRDPTHLRFFGENSADGGRTWTLVFDATYTRRGT